ncbi:MAG: hypothetical protein PWQ37_228 [Candidatus Petromonas sp.]|jgi:predicted Fe-Mo cluster-binding NifX family protein|nr:hypothetical protein [Candidatus Petromonas sp.]
MKIAIAKDGNLISDHFGHCEGFEIFQVENKEVKKRSFIENPGHRPGFLPSYLAQNDVNVVIAGGMGATAQELFKESGIEVIVGTKGNLEEVIQKYINGELQSTGSVCEEHMNHGHCNS